MTSQPCCRTAPCSHHPSIIFWYIVCGSGGSTGTHRSVMHRPVLHAIRAHCPQPFLNFSHCHVFVAPVSLGCMDPCLCRSGLVNLAPTSTGSATAIALIFPELKGKLNGLAVRVPLTNASLTDCVFDVQRPTTVEEVRASSFHVLHVLAAFAASTTTCAVAR